MMPVMVFLVILGLAIFQFYQARQFFEQGMGFDGACRAIVGVAFCFVALIFVLGWMLG